MKKYVHYGSSKFDPKVFKEIQNTGWIKPRGGLWGSPINSSWGWKDWCKTEEFELESLEDSFVFSLKSNARILVIKNKEDVSLLPMSGGLYPSIDYESLKEEYDAIVFLSPAIYARQLYGIDCESIIVLNQTAIVL